MNGGHFNNSSYGLLIFALEIDKEVSANKVIQKEIKDLSENMLNLANRVKLLDYYLSSEISTLEYLQFLKVNCL
jgi:hypothetical protein